MNSRPILLSLARNDSNAPLLTTTNLPDVARAGSAVVIMSSELLALAPLADCSVLLRDGRVSAEPLRAASRQTVMPLAGPSIIASNSERTQ